MGLDPCARHSLFGRTDPYYTDIFYSSCGHKVEPYLIHGSFLKLEYLKTDRCRGELNEDNGTYAIVKVTSHSYRIMANLSINDYVEVMRHP